MKKTILIAILSCIQLHSIFGQTDVRTNDVILESKLLGEERMLKIHLPQDYSEEKLYPVIYITDGETDNFDVARNYIDMLSLEYYDVIPSSILVGITQKNRGSELDPFRSASGKKFKDFIFNEVIPYIDYNYANSGFNVIIGHSDGAEFNQHLLLEENNPFRGFISFSTNFNTDVRNELSDFFKDYDKAPIYYFLANGIRDAYMRVDAGNEFESLYEKSSNHKVKFQKGDFYAGHGGLVPISMVNGLTHIFQDYNNLQLYPTIMDYKEKYVTDMKNNYGIEANYSFFDIALYLDDILPNKKKDAYEYLIEFIDTNNLFLGGKIDAINRGNHYSEMEMHPECIEYFNKAVEEIETLGASFFYQNMHRAINAFKAENRLADAIIFYEKSRDNLPEKYAIYLNYRLAKLSLENNIKVRKGKKALAYCKANFRTNKLFSMDDLAKLEKM